MPHALDDCRAKIAHAGVRVEELTRAVNAFLDRDPYELVHRDDARTGERTISVSVREDPPSAALAMIVGEIVYNLRSALDYVARQLVLANGQSPTTRTEFPIFGNQQQYAADAPRKTRGMSPQAIAVIDGLQPFAWPTPLQRHPLWILHELHNADEHHELSVVGSALQSQEMTITSNIQVAIRPAARMSLGTPVPILPLRDGTELMRIGLVNPVAEGQALATGSFSFGVSFQAPPIVHGQPVVQVMRWLVDSVESLVSSEEILAFFP
jgi:hypothetical protein